MTSVNTSAEETWYDNPPSAAGRYVMLIWTCTAVIISLVGNTTVLVASIKYNAIKLDKISIVLLRNLSAADILYTFYTILLLPLLSQQRDVYGDPFCWVSTAFGYFLAFVDITLICLLNIAKLTTLLYPFDARLRSARTGHIIACTVWLVVSCASTALALYNNLMNEMPFVLDSATYKCSSNVEPDAGSFVAAAFVVVFGITPTLIIAVSSAWLLHFVHKVRGLRMEGVVTVLLVSFVFFVSYVPYSVYEVVRKFMTARSKNTAWFLLFRKFVVYFVYVNYAGNPVVYFVSVRSFREFVMDIFWRLWKGGVGKVWKGGVGNQAAVPSIPTQPVSRV